MSERTTEFVVKRQADVAAFFGRAPATIKDWVSRGMPGSTGHYELGAIARWLGAPGGPWHQATRTESDDPLLAGEGDSPGLERYRLAKAELAELELEQRKDNLIDRVKCRALMLRVATHIRGFGIWLGKTHGTAAVEQFNDTIKEAFDAIQDGFGPPHYNTTPPGQPTESSRPQAPLTEDT